MNEPSNQLFHVIPSFALGGAQVRVIQIMNHLGPRFRHTMVALDGDFSARKRALANVPFTEVRCKRTSNPLLMAARLRTLMNRYRPDLVLTYNWSAIDGAVAALMPPRIPTIHSEDGFGLDEVIQQKKRRVLVRRLVLPHLANVVAPSHALFDIMRNQWQLTGEKVRYIPNGVDTQAFRPANTPPVREEVLIGTAAQLRPEKRLDILLRTVAQVSRRANVCLHIAGDGPKKEELRQLARTLGISSRVRFLGNLENMAEFYRILDIFALTSGTEQMPYAILEATASGLPVVSTDVGDVKMMVSSENRPFVVPESGLSDAMATLVEQADLRKAIGGLNRAHCVENYELAGMLRAYESLYEGLCNKRGQIHL
jgi:glycosyltransferase involved in cell wall biosynthesis